jgi:hypothetical protein
MAHLFARTLFYYHNISTRNSSQSSPTHCCPLSSFCFVSSPLSCEASYNSRIGPLLLFGGSWIPTPSGTGFTITGTKTLLRHVGMFNWNHKNKTGCRRLDVCFSLRSRDSVRLNPIHPSVGGLVTAWERLKEFSWNFILGSFMNICCLTQNFSS